ncbi:DUF86 domain-containing protein [Candidatus Woesearchaeota archaeon]|nr:DUF86 domain-containing protein [Candidatus Woesearchaeota archaeon]
MKRNLKLFLNDISKNIELIDNSVKNISKKDFKSNGILVDATIRRLEIIGEAVKNLPKDFRNRYSHIEWSDIAGFRDVVIHSYFAVDLDKVWNVIKDDLPKLKKDIESISENNK